MDTKHTIVNNCYVCILEKQNICSIGIFRASCSDTICSKSTRKGVKCLILKSLHFLF